MEEERDQEDEANGMTKKEEDSDFWKINRLCLLKEQV